ncbi:MAG: hypothetical protein R3D03_08140 [Geminicoccaceae bacterium]
MSRASAPVHTRPCAILSTASTSLAPFGDPLDEPSVDVIECRVYGGLAVNIEIHDRPHGIFATLDRFPIDTQLRRQPGDDRFARYDAFIEPVNVPGWATMRLAHAIQ